MKSCCPIVFLVFVLSIVPVYAQPELSDTSLRGVQIGVPTELTLKGRGLSKGSKLFLPIEFEQKTLEENGSNSLRIVVTASSKAIPGIYPLRIFNENGISNRILIGVDQLPRKIFSSEKQSLPVALTGMVRGAQTAKTSFSAKKNQRVVVECEANRFGSKLRPVIRVYDSRGKQVAFSQPIESLSGDSRCLLIAPDDGDYFVEMHDFLFRSASPGFFQLKIGEFDFADLCLPVGVKQGSKAVVRMIKTGTESESLSEQTATQFGWTRANVGNAKLFSGFRPTYISSSVTEFVEGKQAKLPVAAGSVPLAINGRIEADREVDRFTIEVDPNSKLRFDLFGRRIKSPIDGRITIKNEMGNVLATNDDRPGQQDALLNYTVPANLKNLIVEVSDITAVGSKSHVYRLLVTSQTVPEVTASVGAQSFNIAGGGRLLLPVSIVRKNYDGEVELNVYPQTSTLHVNGNRVAAGSDVGLLTIANGSDQPQSFRIITAIKADGKKIPNDIQGVVRAPELTYTSDFHVSRTELVTSTVNSKQLDVQWFVPVGSNGLLAGGQFRSKVILNRSDSTKGIIRLRLVTNQRVPKKRIRKDNKDTFVDDTERTVRATPIELPGLQTETDFVVTVPADFSNKELDAVVVAELLSQDKKSVLLSAATSTISLTPRVALQVKLSSGNALTIPQSGVAELTVSGSLIRSDLDNRVRIEVVGLPKGIMVPPAFVPAGQSNFKALLKVPVNAELLKLKKLKLSFSAVDDQDKNWVVAQAKVQTVNLTPAPKATEPAKTDKAAVKKK